MYIIKLLILFYIIIGVRCSSQNHTPGNHSKLVAAAADESCVHKPTNCKPKMNPKTQENTEQPDSPLIITIGQNKSNNEIIKGTIYDIYPQLRRLTKDEAEDFYSTKLFKLTKDILKEKHGIESYDHITEETKNNIIKSIDTILRDEDIIGELLNSNVDSKFISPSLIDNNYDKELYIYPNIDNVKYNGDTAKYISEIVKYMNDLLTNFPENKGESNYSNDNNNHISQIDHKNEPENKIDKNDLQNIIDICKKDSLCKNYFPKTTDKNYRVKGFHFHILKSVFEESDKSKTERFHLLLNINGDNYDNKLSAHPITVIKRKDVNGNVSYERDFSFSPKEVYFYNPIPISDKDLKVHYEYLYKNLNNEINSFVTKCNGINGKVDNKAPAKMDNLNEASLNQLNIYEEESRKRIYTIVDDYSNSMKLNLSNIQKLRLSNMLSEDFINGYKSLRNTNEFPSFTDSMIRIKIKNRLGNENKLYNRQNNVINLNIIHKFINDINSLKHDDVDKLAKILNNISTSKLKKEEIQDFKDNMHSYINDKKLSPTDILNSNAGKILNQIFYHENYETLFTDTVIADDTALTIINGILSGTERDDKRIKKLNIKLFKYIKKEVLSDEIKKDFRKNYKKDENLNQVDQVMNILTQIVNGENYDKIFTKEFLANTNII